MSIIRERERDGYFYTHVHQTYSNIQTEGGYFLLRSHSFALTFVPLMAIFLRHLLSVGFVGWEGRKTNQTPLFPLMRQTNRCRWIRLISTSRLSRPGADGMAFRPFGKS